MSIKQNESFIYYKNQYYPDFIFYKDSDQNSLTFISSNLNGVIF